MSADLHLDIDGVVADIAGEGDRLYLTTDHPVRLLRAAAPLARSAGAGRARAVLGRMASEGLTVTVVGRRGELAHLGAGGGARGIRVVLPPGWRVAAAGFLAVATALVTRRLRHR